MNKPTWHLELERFKSFKSGFILEGNVYDIHPYPTCGADEPVQFLKLDQYLYRFLKESGYPCVVFYNHVDGFYHDFAPQELDTFLRLSSSPRANVNDTALTGNTTHINTVRREASIERATEWIRIALENRTTPVAVVMNMASRYVMTPERLDDAERMNFSRLMLTVLRQPQARSDDGRAINNLLFIVCDKANDVPAWFYLNNPCIKTITISKPGPSVRRSFIDSQIQMFKNASDLSPDELEIHKQKFVDLTAGFSNIELNALRILTKQEQIPIHRIGEAISLYKYGMKENPWNQMSREKLLSAEPYIRSRVKGQEAAITQTLDMIKRAVSGLSGLQHSASSSKPKGILFFAGPTGTGKTELARALANHLFGRDDACIRFDMSEYQQSHSDQKLLGAPPGYVGYEAGGQLTNAVKENPFSILLFDEIEKAHPSILDKFLQILEDGRMTDGRGETVYFSDSIIIFTSNLGIYERDESGARVQCVTPSMSYREIRDRIIQGVKNYFTLELGRPEILNRIGNNIVVFDYIRRDVAESIVQSQLDKIRKSLFELREIHLTLSDEVLTFIQNLCYENLENGGRGIGNVVEKAFINPLARYLFDHDVPSRTSLHVTGICEKADVIELQCLIHSR